MVDARGWNRVNGMASPHMKTVIRLGEFVPKSNEWKCDDTYVGAVVIHKTGRTPIGVASEPIDDRQM